MYTLRNGSYNYAPIHAKKNRQPAFCHLCSSGSSPGSTSMSTRSSFEYRLATANIAIDRQANQISVSCILSANCRSYVGRCSNGNVQFTCRKKRLMRSCARSSSGNCFSRFGKDFGDVMWTRSQASSHCAESGEYERDGHQSTRHQHQHHEVEQEDCERGNNIEK